jgi:XapX domain-containing protein
MNYTKIALGLLLSFVVGAGCKLFGIPAASPPVLSGALLVFAMSSGYWLVDRYLASRQAGKPAQNKQHCGGHALERGPEEASK